MSICENCHFKMIHPNGSLDCLAALGPVTAVHKLRDVLASGECKDYKPRREKFCLWETIKDVWPHIRTECGVSIEIYDDEAESNYCPKCERPVSLE